jgi:glutamate synthase domain-containing protein 1
MQRACINVESAARLGLAVVFLSNAPGADGHHQRRLTRRLVDQACRAEHLDLIDWRPVPVDPNALGDLARSTAPQIEQAIITVGGSVSSSDAEARCYRARKRVERSVRAAGLGAYVASMSFRTMTYKAMCAADQLAAFYPDLRDQRFIAPFAIFHQRYSTNTAPSWERAQPFRMLCHNGEINTIQGNVNRMRAREGRLGASQWADEALLVPVIDERGSDSAMLDNALELLVRGGRDVRQSLAMLVPEAWEGFDVDPAVRDFYRYHACLMEPWDGPAGLIFTDGTRVGAALDRNGLRPLRYAVCDDGLIACASEAGAVDVSGHGQVRRGKLGPGEMLCVDPERGGLEENDAIKTRLAAQEPYGQWLVDNPTTPSCPTWSRGRPPSATRRKSSPTCCDRWRPRVRSRFSRWATTPRSPSWRSRRACSTAISSSASRRSPIRRSTISASGW